MFIDVHELELHPIEFGSEFPPETIALGPEVRQTEPLRAQGRAELVEEHHGAKARKIQDIRLVGRLATQVERYCDRCLEPVQWAVGRSFDLLYRPQGIDGGQEEQSVSTVEAEISYYSGDGLLLEDALREQVLLALPMKTVCREDCKGLCPHCGKNLNQEACSCPPPADEHWGALGDLKQKLGAE
jgi:uncharacterized protein